MKLKEALFSQVLVGLSPVLFHFYILWSYNSDGAGNFYVILSCITFLSMVMSFGQQKGFYAERVLENEEINIAFIFIYFALGFTVFVVAAGLSSFFDLNLFLFSEYITIVLSAVFFTCCNYLSLLHQKQKRLLLGSVIGTVGPYIAAIAAHASISSLLDFNVSVVIVYMASIFVFFLVGTLFLIFRHDYNVRFDISSTRSYYSRSLPYASVSILNSSFTTAPVILCSMLLGPSMVALFVFATKIANVASMPLVAINRISIVKYTNTNSSASFTRNLSRIFHRKSLIVSFPILFIIFIFCEEIIIWGSFDFAGYGYILQILILKHFVNVLTGQTTVVLFSTGNANIVLQNQLLSFCVLVILSTISLYYLDLILILLIFIIPPIINNLLNFFYLTKLVKA